MNWSRVYVRYCMGHKGIPSVSSRWATSSRPLSSNRKFGMNDRKERGALIQVELCGFFHSKRGFRRPKEGAAAWRLPGVLRTPIGRSGGRPPPPERRVRHSCLTRGGPPPLFPNERGAARPEKVRATPPLRKGKAAASAGPLPRAIPRRAFLVHAPRSSLARALSHALGLFVHTRLGGAAQGSTIFNISIIIIKYNT